MPVGGLAADLQNELIKCVSRQATPAPVLTVKIQRPI
jgi:hypothetical protein